MNNNTQQTTQWKKRVEVMEYIYSSLVLNRNTEQILTDVIHQYNFDADQMKMVEYYAFNRKNILDLISNNLGSSWSIERLPIVDLAIIIAAYCEFKSANTPKAVVISQALITTGNYTMPKNKKYINAILEKIAK